MQDGRYKDLMKSKFSIKNGRAIHPGMVKTCRLEGELGGEHRCGDGCAGAWVRRDVDLEMAMRCNEEALKANPGNVWALYGLGKCCIEIRDLEGADAVVKRLQCLDAESYEACVLSGHISLCRDSVRESYYSFIRAYYRATYKDSFLVYGISLFYEAIGDYPSARPWLVLLCRLGVEEHKIYEVLFRTGVCLKKMNLLYSSANVFRVIVYNPFRNTYDTGAQIQMAHIYEMGSKDKLAVEVLDAVRRSKEHRVVASRLHAWIEFKTGDFAGVKRRYRRSAGARRDPYLIYLVGRIKYIEGNYPGALRKYIRAGQMDSLNGMIQNSVGCAHFQMDQFVSAKLAFASALEIDPTSAEASRNLRLVEEVLSEGPSGWRETGHRGSRCPCEPPPSLERTRYMDSQIFLGGPTHAVNPREFNRILPFKTSKLELLPGHR